MAESKVQIICPSGMSGNDPDRLVPCAEVLFQLFKRLYCQLVVLRQRTDEAVAADRTEPDRISGEKVLVIDQVDQVAPGMAGDQDAFDLGL